MSVLAAALSKTGKDVSRTVLTMLGASSITNADTWTVASPTEIVVGQQPSKLQGTLDTKSASVCIGHRGFSEPCYRTLRMGKGSYFLDGSVYSSHGMPKTKSESTDSVTWAKMMMKETDGDFSFVLSTHGHLVAGRSLIGLRPLYYGQNRETIAFGSQRKALWAIGINNPSSFPPGFIADARPEKIELRQIKSIAPFMTEKLSLRHAVIRLEDLLQKSLRKRVAEEKTAIAFSGGLDSSLIALLAKEEISDAHLICASLKGQEETQFAQKVADTIGLQFHKIEFGLEDVKRTMQEVAWLIEAPDVLWTSISIPIYWTAKTASELGCKFLIAGQGADELFGGYERYVREYIERGSFCVKELMRRDMMNLHETNLERDSKTCNYFGIELRLPYLASEIVDFAMRLPLNLKMERSFSTLRKLVLRKAAIDLGLPEEVANKPKKAIQYTTGVSKALQQIARQDGKTTTQYLSDIFKGIYSDKLAVGYD